MNHARLFQTVVVTVFMCPTVGAEEAKLTRGIGVGQVMPLHVVYFVGGARESGKGCPTVMNSNARIRGLEIWSAEPSNEAFALARDLDALLAPEKNDQAFIIVGEKEDSQEVSDLARKHSLAKVTAGVPNSKKLFQNAKFTDESDLYVFFLDRKLIKSRFNFKAAMLTAEARQNLVEQFRAFQSATD